MSGTRRTATRSVEPRRGRRILAGSVAVLVVLAVAWSWGFRLNLPTAHVPVPSSRAAPDEVVRAYVEAYNHRDFRTVAELYPSRPIDGFLPRHRGLGTMNDLRISTSGPDSTYGPDSAYSGSGSGSGSAGSPAQT